MVLLASNLSVRPHRLNTRLGVQITFWCSVYKGISRPANWARLLRETHKLLPLITISKPLGPLIWCSLSLSFLSLHLNTYSFFPFSSSFYRNEIIYSSYFHSKKSFLWIFIVCFIIVNQMRLNLISLLKKKSCQHSLKFHDKDRNKRTMMALNRSPG